MSKFMRSRHVPLNEAEAKALDEQFNAFLDGLEGSGQVLRALRENKGWTLHDLADHTGVDPEHLDAMENGSQPIPEDLADRLSQLFHIRKNIFL